MDDYAGRVLADRYRLPLPSDDAYESVETRAFDTYSGQEVLVRQVPLPEVVDAEVLDAEDPAPEFRRATGRAVRMPADPAVRRAVEAAQAAAQVPDHPRLDQVFDVFAEAGSLWIVSELVAARPLASLLAERPLNPFRAAEIGSDVLTALRVLHAHGWTHRNITVRTVLICDDGRVVLTGLAAGAAEEALCGYVTTPQLDEDEDENGDEDGYGYEGRGGYEIERDHGYEDGGHEAGFGRPALGTGSAGVFAPPLPPLPPLPSEVPASRGPAAIETGRPAGAPPTDDGDASYDSDPYGDASHGDASYDSDASHGDASHGDAPYGDASYDSDPYGDASHSDASCDSDASHGDASHGDGDPYDESDRADDASRAGDVPRGGTGDAAQSRAGRAGAIVAYREGARAAARVSEDRRRAEAGDAGDTGSLPVQRSARPQDTGLPDLPDPDGPSDPDDSRSGPAAPRGRATDDPYSKDRYADDPYAPGPHDIDEDDDGYPPPRRLHLTGSWSDGPGSGRPVPAGGSGEDALRADARRHGDSPALPAHRTAPPQQPGGWDEVAGSGRTDSVYRGPATPLAAERARQTRIAVVGAVTERWAPEQAGPVHENWRLAPPIGPATDLWALGALLYRAVQGHAPYPEENAAELVQMVCGEPPAFAEECGPLRPVVESLLRQDPTERPDFEELSGWLRSLVRSAPEPEAGLDVVPLPSADTARLPIVRRRGELVRRRRGRNATHGRHRHTKSKPDRQSRSGRQDSPDPRTAPDRQDGYGRQDGLDRPGALDGPDRFDRPRAERPPRPPREPKGPKVLRTPPRPHEGGGRAPRRLGRLLLVLILLALAAAVAYAVMFMPGSDDEPGSGSTGPASSASGSPDPGTGDSGGQDSSGSPTSQQPQTSRSAVALAPGYTLRKDKEGFEVGVAKGWQRSPANADRQIRYGSDGFSLLIVPGRDTVKANGDDPLAYQAGKELELQPFRDSSWSGSSGLRRIDVGRQAMAEGQFTWQDASGREVYARNLVMIVEGRYHVIQVIGPENRRDKVSDIYEQAVASYRVTH
ncbi:protein kinase [Streptomyces sp. NPDC047917]|uniref:protein kinase n=1 Tax=Streptomyces sp. NPDC047917 TaxID=3365491 RepID=UPI003711991C